MAEEPQASISHQVRIITVNLYIGPESVLPDVLVIHTIEMILKSKAVNNQWFLWLPHLTHGEYTVSSRSCVVSTCKMHQDASAGTWWRPMSGTICAYAKGLCRKSRKSSILLSMCTTAQQWKTWLCWCDQAQRDYFGAHTYTTLTDPDHPVHTDWTGHGGKVSSTTYSVWLRSASPQFQGLHLTDCVLFIPIANSVSCKLFSCLS